MSVVYNTVTTVTHGAFQTDGTAYYAGYTQRVNDVLGLTTTYS